MTDQDLNRTMAIRGIIFAVTKQIQRIILALASNIREAKGYSWLGSYKYFTIRTGPLTVYRLARQSAKPGGVYCMAYSAIQPYTAFPALYSTVYWVVYCIVLYSGDFADLRAHEDDGSLVRVRDIHDQCSLVAERRWPDYSGQDYWQWQ